MRAVAVGADVIDARAVVVAEGGVAVGIMGEGPRETVAAGVFLARRVFAGLCDVEGGCLFSTAKELFEARIYDGKSIRERWQELVMIGMGGLPIEDLDPNWFR